MDGNDNSTGDTLVNFGGEIKALGDTPEGLHVGGYLVRFSTPDDPDLMGDYFTADTDFGVEDGEEKRVPVMFHHGQALRTREGGEITITRKIGKGTIALDDVGVLIDAIIYQRDEYEQAISQMAKSFGWSSGALGHLVASEPGKKANWIKRWFIGEASITPTPAEPRNNVLPLKMLNPNPEASEAGEDKPAAVEIKSEPTLESQPTGDEMDETDIQKMIETAVESAVKSVVSALPPTNGGGVQVVKDEADQPFANDGEFFMAVKTAALYPNREDPRLRALKATGMSEGVPSDGGYLVRPQVKDGILERMYATGALLSRVARDPVAGNGMTYNGVDETSRVTGSRYGGVQGYWLAEAQTITASKPKFRQIELKLKKVAALCYATDEQLQDTPNLESWLNRVVPGELRFQVEDAIYEGDGVGKPLGIMASPALITVQRDTASSIKVADVMTMWARRWAGVNDYVWFINQDAMPQLPQMTISNSPVFIPPGGLSGSQYGSLLGRPVIEVEYASSLNTTGDIMLASMSQYQTIDKGDVQSATSIHVAFTTAEQAFRFIYRIDGEPLWNSPLTPFKGSSTQSPFVVLGSASA